jgi:hypothetical protein
MICRLGRSLDELSHHMRRRRQIRIAHTEVDDVFTPVPRFHLHSVDDAENVRREPLNPLKFHALSPYPFLFEQIITHFYKLSLIQLQPDDLFASVHPFSGNEMADPTNS